jgi:hypothetical protein
VTKPVFKVKLFLGMPAFSGLSIGFPGIFLPSTPEARQHSPVFPEEPFYLPDGGLDSKL